MAHSKLKKNLSFILRKFLSVEEKQEKKIPLPSEILIIRQHNQFGDMLASVSLLRAFKETNPECKITLLASPENYFAMLNNPMIDELFVFDKKKILNPFYIKRLRFILKKKYDLAVVPVTVAISSTSCLLARLSNSKIKIGPKSLNGEQNELDFVFDYKIDLNWKKCPDSHVSDFILDIIRPFGITTSNFHSVINYSKNDIDEVEKYLCLLNYTEDRPLIGLHVGAGKPQNRWNIDNYVGLVYKLKEKYNAVIYFTGSKADQTELEYIKRYFPDDGYFVNKKISLLAALIDKSNLFITNDTGIMHVAGTTPTPQISLFGPTNPFNWGPIGQNKYFIRKSDFMNDISINDVLAFCETVLSEKSLND